MFKRPKRTSHTLGSLQSIKVQRTHIVRVLAILVVTLGLLELSKSVFQAHLRPDGVVLFVAMVWALAFALDQLQREDTDTQDALTGSEKLQSQKMEAIGRLAGGVAHDFNNLLAVISGYSDLLMESVGSSDPNRAKLEQIKRAANSAAALTRQLLMFSRQQVIQPVILDINQIVANTEKMVRRLIKENIEFTVMLDPTLDRVNADSGQIEQIILNLVVNARDALPNGGKLCIQTSKVREDEDAANPTLSGETVLVVEDARSLRDLICEALTKFGCTVLSARDGQEALRMVRQRQTAIDLLLTDVIMPGMNGQALATEVRLLCPGTKILYMTGYSGEFIQADMLILGVSLIQKPFTPADLGRKISKMLAGKLRERSREAASSHETAPAPKAATARTSG